MLEHSESNMKRVREIIQLIFNGQKTELIPKYYCPSCVCYDPAHGDRQSTFEDLESMIELYRQAFPNYHYSIRDMIATGPQVAFTLQVTGTHTGPFMNFAPTQKSFDVLMMVIATFKDGKITGVTQVHDTGKLFAQLGLNPAEIPTVQDFRDSTV